MGKSVLLILIATALEVALAAILVRRKIYREYPLFLVYLLSSICIEILRLSVVRHYQVYFVVFWITASIYAVLGLLVLHEVFYWFFHEFYKYYRWFWLLFPAVTLAVVAASVWYSISYPPVQANAIISFVLVFGIAVNLTQVGLFLLFFLLDAVLRLRPWNYAFAIVIGFAIAATGALLAYVLRSEFGTKLEPFARYAPPVSYIVAVILWLAVFIRPEQEFTLGPGITPQGLLEQVRRYNQYLNQFRGKQK